MQYVQTLPNDRKGLDIKQKAKIALKYILCPNHF